MQQVFYKDIVIKGIIGMLLFCSGLSACQSVGELKEPKKNTVNVNIPDSLKLAIIRFDETEHNFGRVYEGEQVGWFFKFKNVGTKDLLITNAYANCGCTIPDFNMEPVHPGKESEIKVIFDTKDRYGIQKKTITVESNAQNKKITLIITAEIINR